LWINAHPLSPHKYLTFVTQGYHRVVAACHIYDTDFLFRISGKLEIDSLRPQSDDSGLRVDAKLAIHVAAPSVD
jgi:hypothetical protein